MLSGVDTDLVQLPDGSSFAVLDATEPERTVGFTVANLDDAVMQLRHAGIETDHEVSSNRRFRSAHFRAPDGHLNETHRTDKPAERPLEGSVAQSAVLAQSCPSSCPSKRRDSLILDVTQRDENWS